MFTENDIKIIKNSLEKGFDVVLKRKKDGVQIVEQGQKIIGNVPKKTDK